MKSLSGRIEVLLLGTVISLAMLLGGSEMNAWAVGAYENHTGIFPIILTAALATVALNVGVILLVVFIAVMCNAQARLPMFTNFAEAAFAIGQAACFCFIFGTLGISLNHGMYVNPWDALLVVGFLPLLYFAKEIVRDIGSVLRNRE